MLDKYMYSYNYEESIIHGLNPILKFFSLILFIVSCFFKFDFLLFIISMVWVFVLMMISNISIKRYLKVLWNYKYILIFIYIVIRSFPIDMVFVNIIFFKILACLLYFYVLFFTTTRKDFTNSLGSFFSIGINKKKISSFFDKIYCYIYYFIEGINNNDEAYSLNGNDRIFISNIDKLKTRKEDIRNSIIFTKNKYKLMVNDKYNLLYDDNVYSKYKYRSKLNVFDYMLIVFFILIYVYYIIKVR